MILTTLNKTFKIKQFRINLGPVHPSAHGVGRFIVSLDGETIIRLDSNIGLLHRGTEKLLEHKTYLQGLPYMNRVEYVSMMQQEHVFVLAIEKLLNLTVPKRAQYIRVLFSELTRILNHLLGLTTHQLDIGAITPFLHGFEEREKIFEFYERVSGARMHSAYFRIGGVSRDLPIGLLNDIWIFTQQFPSRLDEMEELITNNRIWKQRTKGIGVITQRDAKEHGFTGIVLRSTGIPYDVRKNMPYEVYNNLFFDVVTGKNGDCYDRYLMRVYEMRQSVRIIEQCILSMPIGSILANNNKVVSPFRSYTSFGMKNTMESLIAHFKLFTEGSSINENCTYVPIESSKGELGVFLESDGSSKPYRVGIRSPGFAHLQGLELMSKDYLIADLVANIGSGDFVFGEIDR